MTRSVWITVVGAVLASGCVGESESLPLEDMCPASAGFEVVSQVIERRCGTLDCHGDGGRSLRIYGRTGLRQPRADAPPGYETAGLVTTTPAEIKANYWSICGLEPETMNDVVKKEKEPGDLLLLRKPRLVESHKGGQVLVDGSPGDRCISSWLAGTVDIAACDAELLLP